MYVADSDVRKNHRYLKLILSQINQSLLVYLVGVDEADMDFKVGSHRIVFRKKISELELVNLYSRTKVYVCPSKLEGFNMPILEALAMNCNIVCSDILVHRELFGDQFNVGFLTGKCIVDKELVLAFLSRENNYLNSDFISHYRWKNRVDELINLINS